MAMIEIETGIFADRGFFKSAVSATLGGVAYSGELKGMYFYNEARDVMYLKGTTSGQLAGTVEATLRAEVSPGERVI